MSDPTAGAIRPAEILATLHAIARPRLSGTAGGEVVADELRARFRQLGFQVRELPFSFSAVPGRYGLPAAGVVVAAMGAGAGWLLDAGRPASAMAALAAGLLTAALPLLLLEPALRRLPWGRVETMNLLFTRAEPRWLIMAHLDTKSQWAPTLVRTAVLAGAALAWAVLVALAVAGLTTGGAGGMGTAQALAWGAAGTLMAAGAVLALSPAGNRSPGALDNGTGLAALLALGSRVAPDVGFLVTDGEELGLAGARAVVAELPEAVVINLDGLGDRGPVRIAESSRDRVSTEAVARALAASAASLGLDVVRRPLPPFVMVDHQPLARAGFPALTLLRGRWRSLLRVHRPGDTVDRLDGTGAAAAATVVALALASLAARQGHTLRPDDGSGHSPAP